MFRTCFWQGGAAPAGTPVRSSLKTAVSTANGSSASWRSVFGQRDQERSQQRRRLLMAGGSPVTVAGEVQILHPQAPGVTVVIGKRNAEPFQHAEYGGIVSR